MARKHYSLALRLWHWAMAICFLLLLITVFFRMTYLNKHVVADILIDQLSNYGQEIERPDAIKIAKAIRNPMWNWHLYFGYTLIGLFLIRFIAPLLGKMKFLNPTAKGIDVMERTKRWIYVVFYVCTTISLVTGFVVEWFPEASIRPLFKTIHKLSLYYLIPFIIIHLFRVIYMDYQSPEGLISRMVSGDRFKKNT